MFVLEKEFRFEASHQLTDHDGKCKNLHGHSWRGVAYFEGNSLQVGGPKKNMLVDFYDVKQLLSEVEEKLDHTHLNSIFTAPTSEYIAEWIFHYLSGRMVGNETFNAVALSAVRIEETCTCACTYTRRAVLRRTT